MSVYTVGIILYIIYYLILNKAGNLSLDDIWGSRLTRFSWIAGEQKKYIQTTIIIAIIMETKTKIPSQNSIHEEFSNSVSNTRSTYALYIHILHIHYKYIVFTPRDVLASARECVRRTYNEIFLSNYHVLLETWRRGEWWAAKVKYVHLRSVYISYYIYI